MRLTQNEMSERNKQIISEYMNGSEIAQIAAKYGLREPGVAYILTDSVQAKSGNNGKRVSLVDLKKLRSAKHSNGHTKLSKASGEFVKFSPTSEARIEITMGALKLSIARGDIESLKSIMALAKEAA